MRPRKAFIALLISLASAMVGGALAWRTNEGLSVDLLYLFSSLAGRDKTAERSPDVVIVAIDEATYANKSFEVPQGLQLPNLGVVIDKLLDSGVKAIGFDQIYTTSVDQFVKGYDRPFLLALSKGAKDGRIVLGKAAHSREILPYIAQIFAVGGTDNLRSLNLSEDSDGVIRRLPVALPNVDADGKEQLEAGMSLELAARAGGKKIAVEPDGAIRLGDTRYLDPANGFLLDLRPWLGALPIYSMGDLFDCAKAGRDDYFQSQFAGKIVLLGQVLDTEDRKLSAVRFVSRSDSYLPAPCMSEAPAESVARPLVPGSILIAAGVDNILRNAALRPARPLAAAMAVWFLTLVATFAAIRRASPRSVLLVIGGTALAWTLAATIAFDFGRVAPLVAGWTALAMALGLIFTWRILSGDRARLGLARAFALYLPKSEIDRLLAEEKPPVLGGEERPVSILFSDIADFTRLSEHRAPTELVADLNAYFGRMTDIVEAHGGFVDKFIGDGMLAVFGAPLRDPDHAAKAIAAGLDMLAALEAPDRPLRLGPDQPIAVRIGVHSGEAVVGNIGSPKRFNYTVIGDAVNLASRLESTAKLYGVPFIVSEATRMACTDRIPFRELDTIRVVGRDQPVRLYQPLSPAEVSRLDLGGFASALEDWRAGRFEIAAGKFLKLSAHDPAGAAFAARARAFAKAPPADWQGITDLTSKGA